LLPGAVTAAFTYWHASTQSLKVMFSASVEGGVLRIYTSQASFLKFILDIILHMSLQVFVSSVILATETIWGFLLKNLNMGRSSGLPTMSCCLRHIMRVFS